MGYFLKNRLLQSGSTSVVLPSGSTATQTPYPDPGAIRYNSDTNLVEFYNGTQWFSLTAGGSSITYTTDTFTGDGSTVSFTMSVASNVNQIQVFVGGIYQQPTTNFTTSGSTITFSSAPANQVPIDVIHTNL